MAMKKLILKYLNGETVSYIIFGVLTTIVGFGLYWLFSRLGFGVAASNTISTVVAVLFAFVTNKLFVFRSASLGGKTVLRELLAFISGRVVTFLMETGLLLMLVDYLRLPNLPSKCATGVLVVVANYIISKWAVFRKPSGTIQ